MKVKVVSSISERKIRELFKDYKFLEFREYGLDKRRLENFAAKEVVRLLEQNEAEAVTIRGNEGELLGFVAYSKLEWDSNHFKIPMAAIYRIVASERATNLRKIKKKAINLALSALKEKRIAHVSTKVDIYDVTTVHALEMAGFRLMDTTVTYAFDFRKTQIPEFEDQCTLRLATSKDENVLAQIAAISFSETRVSEDRFHADPDMPKERSDTLYVDWIRNSVRGKTADATIVAELNGKPVGFTTVKHQRASAEEVGINIGALILSAVLPEARRRNVYTSMIRKGLEYLRPKVDIVELGTQVTNFPVQKAWSKLGFILASATYAFHRTL